MFVLVNRFNNTVNAVYPKEPRGWDRETQFSVTCSEEEYGARTVGTPDGEMPYLDALMRRTGAFSYDSKTGELVHDSEWTERESR